MAKRRKTAPPPAPAVKPPGVISRHKRLPGPLGELRAKLNLSPRSSVNNVVTTALAHICDLEDRLANPPRTSPLDDDSSGLHQML